METICIKLEEDFAKDMDAAIKANRYSTKTEFIREAIRDKLKQMEAIKKLESFFGKAKVKTTDKENRKIREQVGKELAKEYGIDLD